MNAPDSLHDPELVAMAEREQKAATKAAVMVTRSLRALGFHFVLVRVGKVVSHNGDCAMPGATVFDAGDEMSPSLPFEAEEFRRIARELDQEFERRGTHEAEEGYSEDATHRIADFEEPPQ